jgi:hypothetical protein
MAAWANFRGPQAIAMRCPVYTAPPVIKTEIFARVPDSIYITDSETGTILSAKPDVPGKEMYSHM